MRGATIVAYKLVDSLCTEQGKKHLLRYRLHIVALLWAYNRHHVRFEKRPSLCDLDVELVGSFH
eukprot:SAG31_NODE_5561_length_2457_cov_1.765903_3_plen_64_part_00